MWTLVQIVSGLALIFVLATAGAVMGLALWSYPDRGSLWVLSVLLTTVLAWAGAVLAMRAHRGRLAGRSRVAAASLGVALAGATIPGSIGPLRLFDHLPVPALTLGLGLVLLAFEPARGRS